MSYQWHYPYHKHEWKLTQQESILLCTGGLPTIITSLIDSSPILYRMVYFGLVHSLCQEFAHWTPSLLVELSKNSWVLYRHASFYSILSVVCKSNIWYYCHSIVLIRCTRRKRRGSTVKEYVRWNMALSLHLCFHQQEEWLKRPQFSTGD